MKWAISIDSLAVAAVLSGCPGGKLSTRNGSEVCPCPGGSVNMQTCNGAGADAACARDYAGRQCGSDPRCGASCGSCPSGASCSTTSGTCSPVCSPNCAGRNCGLDGCGGSCRTCLAGQSCAPGMCAAVCFLEPPPHRHRDAPRDQPIRRQRGDRGLLRRIAWAGRPRGSRGCLVLMGEELV